MKSILLIIGVTLFISCNCKKQHRWTNEEIQVIMSKSEEIGRKEIRDSIGEVPVVEVVTKKVINYYGSDFGLPSGKVIRFSPVDDYITENQDCDIFIHMEDDLGVRKVYPVDYNTWLIIPRNSVLL